jgi:hypothetical protein
MIKRIYVFSIIISAFICAQSYAQSGQGDPSLLSIGYHTGNRIGISFYNDGQIAGNRTGIDVRGEWPLGSGENYIGDCIPLIGIAFTNSKTGVEQHSVTISRGPRKDQENEKSPQGGYFWGWNPIPGYRNPNYTSVAMSHLPASWPVNGWADQPTWKDANGKTQWNGYFGRGILNADQESYYVSDDQKDDEFNAAFLPDPSNPSRKGMGLRMFVRGFQWANFLAEDCIFWLYDIKNEGKTIYQKADFGSIVGTLAGGDGDSQDDLASFDIDNTITYSWDSDGRGNKGQKVGYVGYAFLESPGNPFDGIDNDNDSRDPNSPHFVESDFNTVRYSAGSTVILIDPVTYERTKHTVVGPIDTVYSLGARFIIEPGITEFREGHYRDVQGVSVPDVTAYDGLDNDLDGLIDENGAIHWKAWSLEGLPGVAYINYFNGAGAANPLIEEKRDNDAGSIISSWQLQPDGTTALVSHWSGDENANWDPAYNDVGSDGIGPDDEGYTGADPDGTEGNGRPDQGEPNFGKTDPDESDQIGLTGFNFFAQSASPSMKEDEILWTRMQPGKFDIIDPQPQDGDFIYSSGYFPLKPEGIERFSVALLMGEDFKDITNNKDVVQQIYNAGYKFPKPPEKPVLTLAQEDGKVVLYWDGSRSENTKDLVTGKKDFQGYRIYRATDAGFSDVRTITNAQGVLTFDKPLAQFDKIDNIDGYFAASSILLDQLGGTTYYLGDNTGIVNKYVDEDVVKGQTYYYAVVAYDSGEEGLDIFPSENSKYIYISNTGQVTADVNTGYITPGDRGAGYTSAKIGTLQKSENFRGTGSASIELIDESRIKDGYSYKIVFTDTAAQGYTKDWSLVDMNTPDTVYLPSTGITRVLYPTESIEVPANQPFFVNGDTALSSSGTYTAGYDTLVAHSSVFSGNTPIKHGFEVQLANDQTIAADTANTFYSDVANPPQSSLVTTWKYTGSAPAGAAYNGIKMPYDYLIEFHSSVVDTSVLDYWYPPTSINTFPAVPVTIKVKNITTNRYIDIAYKKTVTVATTVYDITFKDSVNGAIKSTWWVKLTYNNVNAELPTSGTYRISTYKPFSRYDSFLFTVAAPTVDKEQAKQEINEIKVVPNPYVVTHQAEARLLSSQSSGRGEREIRFTHVPPGSDIYIYTVRGELVKKLRHDNLYVGDVYWNLRSEENIEVAYGVYVYIVDSPGIGKKTGKFALIK